MPRQVRTRKLIRDYGMTILIAIAIALLIRVFLLEAYRIPTPAMVPVLEPGDTIFVGKWRYSLGAPRVPERGKVVVFSLPDEPGLSFIKRVVGLPGDQVEVKDGNVLLNSRLITGIPAADGSGLPCGLETLPEGKSYKACRDKPVLEDLPSQKVPAGSIFVIGDLRSQPRGDVRKLKTWGIIPVSAVKGEALWIWLSIRPKDIGDPPAFLPTLRWSRMFRRIE